jgi:Ran GTPase-activating protein (RanGAP) involved in mRNA processing and transport
MEKEEEDVEIEAIRTITYQEIIEGANEILEEVCEKTNKIKEGELLKLLEAKFEADFGNATLKILKKTFKKLYDPRTKSFICYNIHKNTEEKTGLEEITYYLKL